MRLAANHRTKTLNNKEFKRLQELAHRFSGIKMSEDKRDLLYNRLVKRVDSLSLSTFDQYCDHLEAHGDEEQIFVNSITTNLTSFFREQHHFDMLAQSVFPDVLTKNNDTRRLRIWSAGCSTGEEPYSIAMTVREHIPDTAGYDVRILATDLDTEVLEKCRKGVYVEERIESLSPMQKKRFFQRGTGKNSGTVRAKRELRDMITFKQLNLLEEWPMSGPFDIIFCRNVVIYFDKDTQRRLFARYAQLMAPNGYLFIGHSESLFKVSEEFKLLGNTAYQRAA